MSDTDDDLRFGDALDELETILERIESEETDIDSLADELKRAAKLLEVCRGKIRRAEVEVSQIVQTLGSDPEPPSGQAEDPEPSSGQAEDPEPSPGQAEEPESSTDDDADTESED